MAVPHRLRWQRSRLSRCHFPRNRDPSVVYAFPPRSCVTSVVATRAGTEQPSPLLLLPICKPGEGETYLVPTVHVVSTRSTSNTLVLQSWCVHSPPSSATASEYKISLHPRIFSSTSWGLASAGVEDVSAQRTVQK